MTSVVLIPKPAVNNQIVQLVLNEPWKCLPTNWIHVRIETLILTKYLQKLWRIVCLKQVGSYLKSSFISFSFLIWAFFHLLFSDALKGHLFVVIFRSWVWVCAEQVLDTAFNSSLSISQVSDPRDIVHTVSPTSAVFRVVGKFVWIFRSYKFVVVIWEW